jgi:hypothetical protein
MKARNGEGGVYLVEFGFNNSTESVHTVSEFFQNSFSKSFPVAIFN